MADTRFSVQHNLQTMSLNAILIVENGDPLVDLRRAGGILWGGPPEFPGSEGNYCLVRLQVYKRLLCAQASLPQGYRLRLYEGLRSHASQEILFARQMARVTELEPALRPVEIHHAAKRLVAPVTHWDGTPNVPPHSTGGAVDIEIVDDEGMVIDFGMEIKDWWMVDPQLCAPHSNLLSARARANRALLEQVMTLAGFVKYHEEWWHFSFGDEYWAQATGQRVAVYGPCTAEMISLARTSAKGCDKCQDGALAS